MANASLASARSKISVKSQTVLPRAVREQLGLRPGDTLVYVFDERGILLEKALPPNEEDPFASFTEWASIEDDEAYASL